MTKKELFLELAKPNSDGVSRWVFVNEFVWKYKELQLWNWGSWCRKESSLAKEFIIEFDKKVTSWNWIDAVRLNWLNDEEKWSQHIRKDIKDIIRWQRCVILDTSKPEVDHKNGWKNDLLVMNPKTQKLEDFQPLSKAANDAKRQHCKQCKQTWMRFDAKKLWYPISYIRWDEKHIWEKTWCIGCFWYDPVEFRKHLKFTWN